MSASEYEPTAAVPDSPPVADSEAERRARQIACLVEEERQRHRRTLLICLGLLAVPVALAAAVLLLPHEASAVSADALSRQVTPIVESKVGEQIRPVVEARLGGEIDTVIERRVGDKIQGASPAAVRQLGESVEQLRGELSQVQELKAALPQIRQQLDAQGHSVREIQANQLLVIQRQLVELEQRLDRTVVSLTAKMDENSKQLHALQAKLITPNIFSLPDKKHAMEKFPRQP